MADASTSQINPYVSRLFDLANQVSVPLVQSLTDTRMEPTDADQAVLQERIRNATLNGSGPNDRVAASEAPQGTLDFITGRNTNSTATTGNNTLLWIIIAALGGLLLFLQLRK